MKERHDRDLLIDALHVVILSSFAIAQPLFDLLARQGEFFVVRHSQPVDVILFTLFVMLVPSVLLLVLEGIIGALGRQARKAMHGLIVALLVACLLLPVMKQEEGIPGVFLLVGAVLLGILAAAFYLRFFPIRMFVTVLSPALIIFPGLFLFGSPVTGVVFGDNHAEVAQTAVKTPVPVVLVVFDEFPLFSLMDEHHQIDAARYPNFAALARQATWFRNATAVHASTVAAVPAILSGLYPKQVQFPTAADYPHNLFTLLGDAYAMNVFEPLTALCPKTLCAHDRRNSTLGQRMGSLLSDLSIVYLHIVLPADMAGKLPVITQTWEDFAGKTVVTAETQAQAYRDRAQFFAQFIASITATDDPTLHFLHILLPHVPWEFLSSGKRYQRKEIPGLNIKKEEWGEDEWLVTQGYQRHLLQVGFVDKLLGDLLKRLKTLDLYDQSLIIITADHGASFWPKGSRRNVLPAHAQDIWRVPLFVKAPYQQQGEVSDRPVKTIDIVPTIAEILGIALPWPVDGRSMYTAEPWSVDERSVYTTEVICARGRPAPVIPGMVQGFLDQVSMKNGDVHFEGWAADVENAQLPETLLIFVNGKFFRALHTGAPRPDVVQVYGNPALQKAGFHYIFPRSAFVDVPDAEVRLFAVSRKGLVSELHYPKDYHWKPKALAREASPDANGGGRPCQARMKGRELAPYTLTTIRAASTVLSATANDTLARKLALFGSGAEADRLYKIGPHHGLIGRRVSEIGVRGEAGITVELDQRELYAWIEPESLFVPAYITGQLQPKRGASPPLNLAITVNGVVQAVTRTFMEDEHTVKFAAMVPETAFSAGRNEIEVFVVAEEGKSLWLKRLQSKQDVTYFLTALPGQAEETQNLRCGPIIVSPSWSGIPLRLICGKVSERALTGLRSSVIQLARARR